MMLSDIFKYEIIHHFQKLLYFANTPVLNMYRKNYLLFQSFIHETNCKFNHNKRQKLDNTFNALCIYRRE